MSCICTALKQKRASCGYFWEYKDVDVHIDLEYWLCPLDPHWKGWEVSSHGRFRDRHGHIHIGYNSSGYLNVGINRKIYRVGPIICTFFHGPAPNSSDGKPTHTCHHIDRNPGNNTVDNLCWATYVEQATERSIVRAVRALNPDTGVVMATYPSAAAAARACGGNSKTNNIS